MIIYNKLILLLLINLFLPTCQELISFCASKWRIRKVSRYICPNIHFQQRSYSIYYPISVCRQCILFYILYVSPFKVYVFISTKPWTYRGSFRFIHLLIAKLLVKSTVSVCLLFTLVNIVHKDSSVQTGQTSKTSQAQKT